MMSDAERIAWRRSWICTVIRAGALCYGLFGLGWTGLEVIGRSERLIGFGEFWWYGMPVVFTVVFFVAPAAVLVVMSRWLSRWLAPMPERGCPNCGYSLEKLRTPICPECGADVGRGA